MKTDNFTDECAYLASMHIAKLLLKNGLLTKDEYAEIDTILHNKYCATLGTLLSQNDLIK